MIAHVTRLNVAVQPPLVIKQIIKSRILADCWKKHPKHGTIPIEIYVMSAISNTSYTLPPRRPWDLFRSATTHRDSDALKRHSAHGSPDDEWIEGRAVKGHPNICPLLDFFEDNHYYYLVLPSTTPEHQPNEPPPSSDLFDLVETFPQGLPPGSIRTYLGQIADALCFLHLQGIGERRHRNMCASSVNLSLQFTVMSRMKTLCLGLTESVS
jgi:protein-serine/threonine kinase